MNILQYYIKKNNSIKILITGININILNEIGSLLSEDLSIPVLKINELIKKDYLSNLDDLNLTFFNETIEKNSNFILVGFVNPIKDLKFDFVFNIKFDPNIFKEIKLSNSMENYTFYKNNLQNVKVDKFIKFEDTEKSLDIIFNYLMESISNNIYNKNTIFDKTKNKNKPKKNMDPDNQYVNIEDYNNEMHGIEIYHDNDDDIYKEMEDSKSSLYSNESTTEKLLNDLDSPTEKIFFVNDFFYKNFTGGTKCKEASYAKGIRYLI